jgi:hypothetical protein
VSIDVVATCACGARGEGATVEAALDDLESSCTELDQIVTVLDASGAL